MDSREDLTLREEQDAFDRQLAGLLSSHKGQYALCKGGLPVAFFGSHEEAYAAGLDKFGVDRVFLIAHVAASTPQPVSIAWEVGVMLG